MYIFIYTHAYTCVFVYIHIYVYTHTYTKIHAIDAYMTYMNKYTLMTMRMCLYEHVYN